MTAAARRRTRRTGEARLGVFGGTFDPPHLGHLAIAEWARDRLALDRVIFVPAGQPPHKRVQGRSPARARLAMVRLATRGHAAFSVSTVELDRTGPSFTIDTLRLLRRQQPHARLFLILGGDSLHDFATWRQPEEIARYATLVSAWRPPGEGRGGRHGAGTGRRPRSMVQLDNPMIAISSSLVRRRVRQGKSIRFLVPDGVARFIERTGLYRYALRRKPR